MYTFHFLHAFPALSPDLSLGPFRTHGAQVVSYPLALVRTRMQAQALHQRAPDGSLVLGQLKYRGMMDVFRKTLAHEGVRGLYKGMLPNLLKLAPAAGIGWFVFEETKLALGVDPRS